MSSSSSSAETVAITEEELLSPEGSINYVSDGAQRTCATLKDIVFQQNPSFSPDNSGGKCFQEEFAVKTLFLLSYVLEDSEKIPSARDPVDFTLNWLKFALPIVQYISSTSSCVEMMSTLCLSESLPPQPSGPWIYESFQDGSTASISAVSYLNTSNGGHLFANENSIDIPKNSDHWGKICAQMQVDLSLLRLHESLNNIIKSLEDNKLRSEDEAKKMSIENYQILCSILQNEVMFAFLCTIILDPLVTRFVTGELGLLAFLNTTISHSFREPMKTKLSSVNFQKAILLFRTNEIMYAKSGLCVDRDNLCVLYSVFQEGFNIGFDFLKLLQCQASIDMKCIGPYTKSVSSLLRWPQFMAESLLNDTSYPFVENDRNFCMFHSSSGLSRFSDVYNFFIRRITRTCDNPLFDSFSKSSEFIFLQIIPSLIDYIGQNGSDDTAVQFNVGFQQAIVSLINWCLTVKGPETVKNCKKDDVMSFLMSSYMLLGGSNLISDTKIWRSHLDFTEQTFEGGLRYSWRLHWDLDTISKESKLEFLRLISWFHLHDEILKLMSKYYMICDFCDVEAVLYILHYAVDVECSTHLISLRLILWLTVYIHDKENLPADSPILISILDGVFSLLEGCKLAENHEQSFFIPAIGVSVFDLIREIMKSFCSSWANFLISGIDHNYALSKETLSQMVPTPSGNRTVLKISRNDRGDLEFPNATIRSSYIDCIVALLSNDYHRSSAKEILFSTISVLGSPTFESMCSNKLIIAVLRSVSFNIYSRLSEVPKTDIEQDERFSYVMHGLSLLIDVLRHEDNQEFLPRLQDLFKDYVVSEYPELFFKFNDTNSENVKNILYLQLTLLASIVMKRLDLQEKLHDWICDYNGDPSFLGIESLVLHSEPAPTFPTIIVLFDMLLDSRRWFPKEIYQRRYDPDSIFEFLSTCSIRPRICNRYIISVIMSVARAGNDDLRKFVFVVFQMLVDESAPVVNITSISTNIIGDKTLFDIILDQFPLYGREIQVHAAKLLQTLGKHSISIAQMKKIFRIIQSKGKYRPSYTSLLLQSLKEMMTEKRIPRQFFILEGIESGLVLPPIRRWPTGKAFSFSIWFKLESHRYDLSYADETSFIDSLVYTPYLLSLRTDKRAGFEVYFTKISGETGKFRLHVKSYTSGISNDNSALCPQTIRVQEGTWHFLGISLLGTSSLSSKCEIGLSLDDKFIRHPFNFPSFQGSIENPCIGKNGGIGKSETNVISAFKGQIGAVNFFADALSEGQLLGIYALGPNYLYCFEQSSLSSCIRAETAESHVVDPVTSTLGGNLMSKLMLSFNSAGWNGEFYLDNTPRKNSVKLCHCMSSSEMHEKTTNITPLPGTHRVERCDFRSTLESLGGIKIILPLFMQLNQPRLSPEGNIISDTDLDLSINILKLVREIMKSGPESAYSYMKSSGFSLISYFLEQISENHLTKSFSDALNSLYPQEINADVNFQDCLLEFIFFNFEMFCKGSLEFQEYHLGEVHKFLVEKPSRIRKLIGTKKIFNVLLSNIKYSGSFSSGYVEEAFANVDKNLKIRKLRSTLFDTLRLAFTSDDCISNEEVSELIIYILIADTPEAKCDGLALLSDILTNPASEKSLSIVMSCLVEDKNFIALLTLFESSSLFLTLSLFIFCMQVIQLSSKRKVVTLHSEVLSSYFGLFVNMAAESISALGLKSEHLSSIVVSWVKKIEASQIILQLQTETYHKILLFSLQFALYGEPCLKLAKFLDKLHWQFIEGISRDNLDRVCSSQIPSYEKYRSLMDAKIAIPMVFPAILHLCKSNYIPETLRLTTIVNLRAAISLKSENADQIIRIPHWQENIFSLYVTEVDRKNRYATESGTRMDKLQGIIDSLVRLLCDLLMMAIKIGLPLGPASIVDPEADGTYTLTIEDIHRDMSKGERQLGAIALRDTISHLRVYGELGRLDVLSTGVDILQQVFALLKHECEQAGSRTNISASMIQTYCIRVLHLNIWLSACVVMDFFTIPIVQLQRSLYSRDRSSSAEGEEVFLDSTFVFENSSCDDFASIYFKTYITKFGSNISSVWRVLDTLLNMLDPLDHASESFMSETTFKRQVAKHFGVITSKRMIAQVHEDVDDFISSTTSSPVKMAYPKSRVVGPLLTNALSPIEQATESVHWTVFRFLMSYVENGIEYLGVVTPEDYILRAMVAIQKLESVASTVRTKIIEHHNFECINIISRLSFIFQAVNVTRTSNWAKLAGSLLIALIVQQKENILSIFRAFQSNVPITDIYELIKSSPGILVTDAPDEINFKVIHYVNKILEVTISEEDWNSMMFLILEEAKKSEEISVESRLDERGSHKHSQVLKAQLSEFISVENIAVCDIVDGANFASAELKMHDSVKSDELEKAKELRQKKLKAIYKTSLNEHQALFSRDFGETVAVPHETTEDLDWSVEKPKFWMLDFTENSLRWRFRLIQNMHGTRHSTASSLAGFGCSTSILSNADPQVYGESQTSESSISTLSHATRSMSSDIVSDYKDIIRYRNRSDEVAAIDEDDEPLESQKPEHGGSEIIDTGKVLLTIPVDIITPSTNSSGGKTSGLLQVTRQRISFTRSDTSSSVVVDNQEIAWAIQKYPNITWNMQDLYSIWQRSYQFRFLAVELFFLSKKSVFISTQNEKVGRQLFFLIRKYMRWPHSMPYMGRRPEILIQKFSLPSQSGMSITAAWVKRKISNFDYLMLLNTLSGRTFNDLGQYPVFPWILKDYTSAILDLSNCDTFRDLEWPMGAQGEDERNAVQSKFRDLAELYNDAHLESDMGDMMPPFHHGSHYSTMGFVLWYLVRLEPFSSLHIWLQDGKFDKADRLFDSIEKTWKSCISNSSDVKELIPEFFTCPEIFLNINKYDLGSTQNGKTIADVTLPPWADNAYDFVYKHREALESDYVSQNLHNWIDLIWGYKQRPPHLGGNAAAVDACNVFFNLTYSGSVDLKNLQEENKELYNKTCAHIDNFGQIPTQLFQDAHPSRIPLTEIDVSVWPVASTPVEALGIYIARNRELKWPNFVMGFPATPLSTRPIIFVFCSPLKDRLITIDTAQTIGFHGFQYLKPDANPPYNLEIDEVSREISSKSSVSSLVRYMRSYGSGKAKNIGVPFAYQKLGLLHASSLTESKVLTGPEKSTSYEQKERNRAKIRLNRSGQVVDSDLKSQDAVSSIENEESESNPVRVRHGSASSIQSSAQRPSNIQTSPLRSSSIQSSPLRPTGDGGGSVSGGGAGGGGSIRGGNRSRVGSESYPSRSESDSTFSVTTSASSTISIGQQQCDDNVSPLLFAVLTEVGNPKFIFSCGHWDLSCKVTVPDTGKLLQSVTKQLDVLTCLALASECGQHWLVTGSLDCTVVVWDINADDREAPLAFRNILYGHDGPVRSIAASADLDTIISGSEDGTVLMYSLREGLYLRCIDLKLSNSFQKEFPISPLGYVTVSWIGLSKESIVLTYLSEIQMLCSHSINGQLLAAVSVEDKLNAFLISEDGHVLVTGGRNCLVVKRWVRNLELATRERKDTKKKASNAIIDGRRNDTDTDIIRSPIRSLAFSKDEQHLIVGLESGSIKILSQEPSYLRQKLKDRLLGLGF